MSTRPAVFLDRDGTLIAGLGYLGDPDGVKPLPGVREALEDLGEKGWLRIVVTNQSGVARGYFSEADYHAVEQRVAELLPGIDASYACFHLPDGSVEPWNAVCTCRKPLPGMLLTAAQMHRIDLTGSVLLGDDLRDLEAARAAGVRAVLVRTGKGAGNEARLVEAGLGDVEVFDDVAAFARTLSVATTHDSGEETRGATT